MTSIWRTAFLAVAVSVIISSAYADNVVLKDGRIITGSIILRDEKEVVITTDSGVAHYPTSSINEIQTHDHTVKSNTSASQSLAHLPSSTDVIKSLKKQKWAFELQQIPATVIDKGFMRNVPYISYRCSKDYEVNIYGDPENPACIEIGIYRDLLTSGSAKKNCIDFISSLFSASTLQEAVQNLDRKKDLVVVNGLTLEITPETSEDAYGGWWISVYSESSLNTARASDREISQISIAASDSTKTKKKNIAAEWSPDELKLARRTPDTASQDKQSLINAGTADPTPSPTPPQTSSSVPSDVPSSSGGRVYVHGYYRKNGTYVNSYTRRSPSY